MSETSVSGQKVKLLGLMALMDLLTGVVLAVVGVSSDTEVLVVAGVVLLLSGAAMLAFVAWRRNQPGSP